MRNLCRFICLLVFLGLVIPFSYAQTLVLRGNITDALTGSAVPYATVSIKSMQLSTPSDFEGNFLFKLNSLPDSIEIAYIGYLKKTVAVPKSKEKITELNVQIFSNSMMLDEIVVGPKSNENPAWRVMRQIVKHKSENNYSTLKAYQYESYNRIILSATNFSEKLKKKKIVKQMQPLMDSLKKVAGKDGTANLPIFVSESYSENYFKKNPFKKKEKILKTRVKGVGFEDGTLLSQLVGSTFLQHNFYKNYISVAGKEFISPINDNWRLFYDYTLESSQAMIDTTVCFKINFKPKSKSDLAFIGTMWISKSNYALCQLSATVSSETNLNFISKVEIQQESKPFNDIWFPSKSRILVQIDQLNKNTPGLLAQFYLNNSKLELSEPKNDAFYEQEIVVSDSASQKNELFWQQKTPPTLSATQQHIFRMIDTLKSLPAVKTYIDVADMVLNGYYKLGKIGLGPYLFSFARNDVEGNRIRLGFKTNYEFSNRWILEPYVAYGDKDGKFKYGATVDYIVSRKPWTQVGTSYSHDLNQVALLSENYNYAKNNLFAAFARFGRINRNRRAFMQNRWTTYISSDILKNVNAKIQFDYWTFDPLYRFGYQENAHSNHIKRGFNTAEFEGEIKWSPGVIQLQSENKNKPVSVKSSSVFPVFHFHYTLGIKGVMNSDFNYQKFIANVSQKLKLGIFGKGDYTITAGYIPSKVPYPILENHLGNNTFFYNKTSFNTMRFFEFISDKYASLMYTQHFEGMILNRIPLLEKLHLRELATFNMLYGSLSTDNRNSFANGAANNNIYSKGLNPNIPYMEIGYGVENIFKFLRFDVIHRLNYRDVHLPGQGLPHPVSFKISAQIRL